jgi:hypothetical protein
MNRQEYWKSKGVTEEQIQNHLSFERYKGKLSRERRKKNNLKNEALIKQIKKDLIGKTYGMKRKCTVLSIRPTADGQGFWFSYRKDFEDGSSGIFREFSSFEGYDKNYFTNYLEL